MNKLMFHPTLGHLAIAQFLLLLVVIVHLAYIGVVFGTTLLSVALNILDRDHRNEQYRRLSRYLIGLGAADPVMAFFLGVMPPLTAAILYAQILYGSAEESAVTLAASVVLFAAGFVFLFAYKNSFPRRDINYLAHIVPGVAALATLTAATYVANSAITLAIDPEKWPYITAPYLVLIFAWNNIARFMQVAAVGLVLTGTALLLFHFCWPDRERSTDPDYDTFVRNFGAGVALAGLFPLPVFCLWNIITLPWAAVSAPLYSSYLIAIVLLGLVTHSLYRLVTTPERRPGARLFIGAIAVLCAIVFADTVARQNANADYTDLLAMQAQKAAMNLEAQREAAMAATAGTEEVSVAKGEDVYKRICSTCHSFDHKVVGPPYNQTVPKYLNNPQALEAFIRNPTLKTPGYPPMPQLGLKNSEIASVAKYLIQTVSSERKSGKAQ